MLVLSIPCLLLPLVQYVEFGRGSKELGIPTVSVTVSVLLMVVHVSHTILASL